ncbi:hypothetical protein HIM_02946 [Hirsutella minnesotensis 3608]|nr:hypothetical protein HIM_02946 [Hirsutella minnesotensis 3608]
MKSSLLLALTALGSLALARPTILVARPRPGDELLPWFEPGGCSGSFEEKCMGTALFCATRDEAECLEQREAPPHADETPPVLTQKPMPAVGHAS